MVCVEKKIQQTNIPQDKAGNGDERLPGLPDFEPASDLNPYASLCEEIKKKRKKTNRKKGMKLKNIPQDKALSNGDGDERVPGLRDFEPTSDLNPFASLCEEVKKKNKKKKTNRKKGIKQKNIPQDKTLTNDIELSSIPGFEEHTSGLNPYVPQWERRNMDRAQKEELPSNIESLSSLNPYAPVYYEDLVQMCHEDCEPPSPELEEEELLIDNGGLNQHLPIDDHEDEILRNISTNRVTIIHGETGCGKSSKIPLMLLNNGGGTDPNNVRMFISQPRRIAAQGLMERVRTFPGYKDIIGMRLGHGTKDETPLTRVWFVTTGYLVRLLAHHPEAFDKYSHLVIDEVHERSVDTDILCLLAKRLVNDHPTLRLIIMSATMSTEMYREYFDVHQPAIFVGARHFPIREIYADDLADGLCMDRNISAKAMSLIKGTRYGQKLSRELMTVQYEMAVQVTKAVGIPGSSVLIFVSGMSDILELTDRFERLKGRYQYWTLPIHSDLPSDDQLQAFKPAPEGTVKIVIATNAAESSVTLPDVDHVICLGQVKLIKYDSGTHRTRLSQCWISKASATQRAGRTGRVRPGTVYRLYARELYEYGMVDHEEGEVHRQPLDGVILNLKNILSDAVIPILQDILEPPNIDLVGRSFISLFSNDLIDSPCDEGNMTLMGKFVAGVGLDLCLGQMIGLGAQFGCLPEAVCMASVLSVPKLPFRITNPLIHDDPHIYNDIGGKVLLSQQNFDNGLYSDPLMLVQLISVYESMDAKYRHNFCMKWSLSHARFRQLLSTLHCLQERAALSLGMKVSDLRLNSDFAASRAKVNILRLLLVWTLHDNLIVSTISTKPSKSPFVVNITATEHVRSISHEEIRKSLPDDVRSTMAHNSGVRITYTANCRTPLSCEDIENSVKKRVMDELEADCSWVFFKHDYGGYDEYPFDLLHDLEYLSFTEIEDLDQLDGESSKSRRDQGIVLWIRSSRMELVDDILDSLSHITSRTEYIEGYGPSSDCDLEKSGVEEPSPLKEFRARASKTNLRRVKAILDRLPKCMCVNIFPGQIIVQSAGLKLGSETLQSIFQVEKGITFSKQGIREKHAVYFPSSSTSSEHSQDLLNDAPIGVRILNQLACGYRDRKMRIWKDERKLKKLSLKLGVKPLRWYLAPHTGRVGFVILPCFSLSAACNPVHPTEVNMYAVAGLMLDLQSGGARAERVTILPLGENWITLALLAFGRGRHSGEANMHRHSMTGTLSEEKLQDAEYFSSQYQYFNKKSGKLEANMDLIEALNELFGFDHNPKDYCNQSGR